MHIWVIVTNSRLFIKVQNVSTKNKTTTGILELIPIIIKDLHIVVIQTCSCPNEQNALINESEQFTDYSTVLDRTS